MVLTIYLYAPTPRNARNTTDYTTSTRPAKCSGGAHYQTVKSNIAYILTISNMVAKFGYIISTKR